MTLRNRRYLRPITSLTPFERSPAPALPLLATPPSVVPPVTRPGCPPTPDVSFPVTALKPLSQNPATEPASASGPPPPASPASTATPGLKSRETTQPAAVATPATGSAAASPVPAHSAERSAGPAPTPRRSQRAVTGTHPDTWRHISVTIEFSRLGSKTGEDVEIPTHCLHPAFGSFIVFPICLP